MKLLSILCERGGRKIESKKGRKRAPHDIWLPPPTINFSGYTFVFIFAIEGFKQCHLRVY